ncbi:MAG TPA: 3-deoxy-D-manno-octulosonate 8-phosphate phosphatase [Anaeromyxobacter sp.]|nr:3-deoxy-D-manno-octulosonate 8-phosphate phosphatase [Anaeromyxobacter sp.]
MRPHRPAASRSRIPPRELLRRAAQIRLLLLDVDGVLTDGRLFYGPEGEERVAFDVKDGHGIVLLRDHIEVGVISGRAGRAARPRLEELRVRHLLLGERDKLAAYGRLAALGFADAEVAYMGDDVNDLPLLLRVGLSACPADALPEVRARVHFCAGAAGGRGAVRELCDLLLRARGLP